MFVRSVYCLKPGLRTIWRLTESRCPFVFLCKVSPRRKMSRLNVWGGIPGRPKTVLGRPRIVLGRPRTVLGRPRTVLGRPRTVLGHPRTVLGAPRIVLGVPRTAPEILTKIRKFDDLCEDLLVCARQICPLEACVTARGPVLCLAATY